LLGVAVTLVTGVWLGVRGAEGFGDALISGGGLAVDAVGVDLQQDRPCPARRATSVAGTPEFNQSDTAACRRS
jgi:hypothetical protein